MKTSFNDQLDITRRDLMKGGMGAASLAAVSAGAAVPAAVTAASVAVTANAAQAQQHAASATVTQPATGIVIVVGVEILRLVRPVVEHVRFCRSGPVEIVDGSYAITFPAGQEPPVNGFWSLTLYNDKHLFHANDLKRYSLGTKNKNLKPPTVRLPSTPARSRPGATSTQRHYRLSALAIEPPRSRAAAKSHRELPLCPNRRGCRARTSRPARAASCFLFVTLHSALSASRRAPTRLAVVSLISVLRCIRQVECTGAVGRKLLYNR